MNQMKHKVSTFSSFVFFPFQMIHTIRKLYIYVYVIDAYQQGKHKLSTFRSWKKEQGGHEDQQCHLVYTLWLP